MPFMTRRWLRAWRVSANEMARKSLAMFGNPSSSACSAKTMYFSAAWLSPAKAALRLASVIALRSSGLGRRFSKASSIRTP